MRLLLDTHVAVWTLVSSKLISASGRALIADPANEVYVSVVSIWEIAIKHALGRSSAPVLSADQAIEEFAISGFAILDITATHAAATQTLPLLHKDPFDRLLVAQALAGPMRLLTRDPQVIRYDSSITRV